MTDSRKTPAPLGPWVEDPRGRTVRRDGFSRPQKQSYPEGSQTPRKAAQQNLEPQRGGTVWQEMAVADRVLSREEKR